MGAGGHLLNEYYITAASANEITIEQLPGSGGELMAEKKKAAADGPLRNSETSDTYFGGGVVVSAFLDFLPPL